MSFVLAQLFANNVTLDKLLNFSVFQLLLLLKGDDNIIYFINCSNKKDNVHEVFSTIPGT